MIRFFLKVVDNGSGISPEGLKTLFVDFNSLNEHRSQNRRGTGLGLSICKQIVESMGGQINVTSDVNKGTTFSIDFTFLHEVEQL